MSVESAGVVSESIAFVLIPDFSMIAFASAIEPLRIANRLAGRKLYDIVLVSQDGRPVRCSAGVRVEVDRRMDQLELRVGAGNWTVVVCSGLGAERFNDRETFAFLRRMDRHGAVIGGVCTAAHILARAGLITDHRCTIHWENLPGFVEAFPDLDVAADLFEVDRNRFTCSGGTAPLDMMLNRINERFGDELATKVSEQCLLDRIRGPQDRQRMPIRIRLGVHHPKLIMAIELMEANIEEPLSQELLAKYVALSRRQLERLFRRHLGRTPAQYYLELRLERARHLLYQTDLPIMNIACACGFVSASHFSTCYRQMFGRTPRAERNEAA